MSQLTEYEKLRLENIKTNNTYLKSLGLSVDSLVSVKPAISKKRKIDSVKIKKEDAPEAVPTRMSLRTRGQKPDPTIAVAEDPVKLEANGRKRIAGTISMDQEEDESFLEKLRSLNKAVVEWSPEGGEGGEDDVPLNKNAIQNYVIPVVEPGSVKVMREMIYSITLHPNPQKILAMVGDKKGSLGIWDVTDTLDQCKVLQENEENENAEEEDQPELEAKVISFKPHTGSIAKILISPTDQGKFYTSSFDGSVRLMDFEKQTFEEVYVHPNEDSIGLIDIYENSVWFCTHQGEIGYTDLRTARRKMDANLYEGSPKKLNTISINPRSPHLIVTAGLDHVVRVFDIRNLKKEEPAEPIATFSHSKSVNSAFWEGIYGNDILSTSFDDTLSLWKNAGSSEGDEKHIAIAHNNNTGKWVQKFKATYRPFDLDGVPIFNCGSMNRELGIWNGKTGRQIANLSEPLLTAIPAVNTFHPNPALGMLVSGNGSGRMTVWM